MPDPGEQLVREEGEADGFRDVCGRYGVELAVGVEGGEDARGEPVERDIG